MTVTKTTYVFNVRSNVDYEGIILDRFPNRDKFALRFAYNLIREFAEGPAWLCGETDSGMIRCTCEVYKKADWCDHVQDTIVSRWDTWHTIEALAGAPTLIWVPIIPTAKFNLIVRLEDPDSGGGRAVYLPAGWSKPTGDIEFTYLVPGDSRATIRDAFVDWLRANAYRHPTCQKRHHNLLRWSKSDQGYHNRDKELAVEDMHAVWTLLSTGWCGECVAPDLPDMQEDAPVLDTLSANFNIATRCCPFCGEEMSHGAFTRHILNDPTCGKKY